MTTATLDLPVYRPYGGARRGWLETAREVLFEGPAGTGKTRADLERARWLGEEMYPGMRILFLRDTRKSLNQSILETWEEKGVLCGSSRQCLSPHRSRENREEYVLPRRRVVHVEGADYGYPEAHPEWRITFPAREDWPGGERRRMYEGQTRVVLGGMDNPERLYSTEFDLIFGFEGIEFLEEASLKLLRALRNNHCPFQQIVFETNPGAVRQWLNQRFPPQEQAGVVVDNRVRILSRHVDNPTLTREYVRETLDKGLHGADRARLYLGLWTSAEGQVWPNYDPAVHCIYEAAVPKIKWYFGSQDWGYAKDPGVAQVWGVGFDEKLYRVVEIYRCGVSNDEWARWWNELHEEFTLQAITADPSRPDLIDQLNDRLGWKRGRDREFIVRGAENKRGGGGTPGNDWGGLDMVRWAFDPDDDDRRAWFKKKEREYTTKDVEGAPEVGTPRMFFVKEALRHGPCEVRQEKRKPWSTEQEIPSYVLRADEEGKRVKDEPDPLCSDHGADCARYASTFFWNWDLSPAVPEPQYPEGSYGAMLRHNRWPDGPSARMRRAGWVS